MHPTDCRQVSCVHGLPSSQSALAVQTRQPEVGVPMHRPFTHMSLMVHELPSLQAMPLCAVCVQPD